MHGTDEGLAALNREPERLRSIRGRPATRPRASSTLILLDHSGPVPKVLLGRRNASLRFAPDILVFPGGAVDRADLRSPADGALPASCMSRLIASGLTPGGARAHAMAAIRELAEETGLLLGKPGARPGVLPDFAGHGLVPSLDGLAYVARAVTPPSRPRRFDTRFFVADAAHIQGRIDGRAGPGCELVDLLWIDIDATADLDLHPMTQTVLREVHHCLAGGRWCGAAVPAYLVRHGRFVRELTS